MIVFCRIYCASGTGMVDLKNNGMQKETCPDVVRFHKCAQNNLILFVMEGKLDRIAFEWLNKHPKATLVEAYKAGYLRCTEAWCNKET